MDTKPNKEVGIDLANQLMDAINHMGGERDLVEGFMEGIIRSHRTLQQGSGRLLIAYIRHFADMYVKNQYDLRNEALCKLCAKLKPIMEEATFGCDALPFI